MGNLADHGGRPAVAVARQAELSWERLPEVERETMRDMVGRSAQAVPRPTIIHVENRKLAIQRTPSGYMVVYRPGEQANTIVSVFTPREADGLLGAPA